MNTPVGETVVVVPCFNEAARLDLTAFARLLGNGGGVSFLFVDDGSGDDTPRVLERLREQFPQQISVLRLANNVGKAEAVRRGVQVALRRRPAVVGFWDADLATPLEAIDEFVALFETRPELSVVMGARVKLLGRRIDRRPMRHLLGRAFATAASLALRLPVYDTQCGAKLFRVTPEVADVFRQPFRSRWVFDVEILARLKAAAARAKSLPVEESIYEYPLVEWQDVRGSRLKPVDFFVAALDLAALYWRYRGGGDVAPVDRSRRVVAPVPEIARRDAA